jgi:hypothetical protein
MPKICCGPKGKEILVSEQNTKRRNWKYNRRSKMRVEMIMMISARLNWITALSDRQLDFVLAMTGIFIDYFTMF